MSDRRKGVLNFQILTDGSPALSSLFLFSLVRSENNQQKSVQWTCLFSAINVMQIF